jgi:uncharacterized protein YkwD
MIVLDSSIMGKLLLTSLLAGLLLAGCSLSPGIAALLVVFPQATPVSISFLEPTVPPPSTQTPFIPDGYGSTFTRTPFQPVANTLTFTPSATETETSTPTSTQTPEPTSTETAVFYTPTRTSTPRVVWIPPSPYPLYVTSTFTFFDPPTLTSTIEYYPTATFFPTATLDYFIQPTDTQASPPTQTPTVTLTPMPTNTQPATATFIPVQGCSPSYDSSLENQVVALINQERANNGLPALTVQPALTAAARGHGADMACNGFFSHIGSDGSTSHDRIARQGYYATWWGENIFGGQMSTPTLVVNWWMNSTPHRANILNTNYTSFGVGYVYLNSSLYQKYWVMVFAKP